jgi:uncharacterized protein YbaR (Trm112 family)
MFEAITTMYSFLRCPICGGKFRFSTATRSTNQANAILHCDKCHSDYCIKNYIPSLLPLHFTEIVSRFGKLSNNATMEINSSDLANAHKWLSRILQLPLGEAPENLTLLQVFARLLKLCSQFGMSFEDTCEIASMWASYAMSPYYRKSVADQMYGAIEAISYERYEDILLRLIMNDLLKAKKVALIEIGSGVGRVLHQYGSCISIREDAAPRYRLNFPQLYAPNSLNRPDNLRLIIGLDFQQKMLRIATLWLREKESRLFDLVKEGRIIQIKGSARYMPFSLNNPEYSNIYKVVCILFQTLGNQLTRELQVDMLKKAWQLVFPEGLLIVSVFNREVFDEQALPYYFGIKKSVGNKVYLKDGTFLSSKGVYSRWFQEEELKSLFVDANIKDFTILSGRGFKGFSDFQGYLNLESQNIYKRRALIGIGTAPTYLKSISKLLRG